MLTIIDKFDRCEQNLPNPTKVFKLFDLGLEDMTFDSYCWGGRVLIWIFLLLSTCCPIKRRFYVTGFPRDVKKRQDTSPYEPVCAILIDDLMGL
jgi:hypothetical protein